MFYKKTLTLTTLFFLLGFGSGALIFRDKPMTLRTLESCLDNCLTIKDILGLVARLGLTIAPDWTPGLIKESDKCVAILHPKPRRGAKKHFVLFPKADVRDISHIELDNAAYLIDCFFMINDFKNDLRSNNYKIETNGKFRQHITYLHFHLIFY